MRWRNFLKSSALKQADAMRPEAVLMINHIEEQPTPN
jgi:hypothetical protein